MAYDLIPEQMYHPFGGMNPDANGIMARPNEAVDVLNCSLTSSTVEPRGGTRYLRQILPTPTLAVAGGEDGGNTPSYNDIGVDANGYFQYDAGPFTIRHTVVTGRWEIREIGAPLYYIENTGVSVPESGWKRALNDEDSALTVTRNIAGALPEPVIKFHEYVHPEDGLMIFAFCANGIYRFDGLDWVTAVGGTPVALLEQWSITNYIDREIGATIVAAGSLYTRPTESYVNGSDRILIYFDPDTNLFEHLQLTSDEPAQQTFASINPPGPPYIYTGTVANTPIIEGTTYMVLESVGVICTTGLNTFDNGGNIAQYLLSVNAEDSFVEGPNSWIELETGNFSVEFSDTLIGNPDLLVLYSHEVDVDYRPLYVANFHNALVLANTYEPLSTGRHYFGWRVRWTQPNDMNTVLQSDYQELALSDITPILLMASLETSASSTIVGPLYFYKHNSIIRGTYNQAYGLDPDLPVPLFSFEIAFSEGIEATNTLVNSNGVHIFLGRNDIYMFDGYQRRSITHDDATGNTKIQRVLFDVLDLDNLNHCFGIYDEVQRQYGLYFTSLNDSQPFPTTAAIYDIDRNTWKRATVPPTSAGISTDIAPLGIIARLPGWIEELEGTIDSLTGNQSKLILLAMPDLVYYLTSAGSRDREGIWEDEIISYFITRDFFGQTLEEHDRAQKVILEAIGDEIEVSWNGDYSWTPSDFKDPQTLKFSGEKYRREDYHPDAVTTAIRYLVQLKGITQFRWLQSFSIKQEFTNE